MPIDFDRGVAQATGGLPPHAMRLPRLNLGSGLDRREGFVNLDRVPIPEVDVTATLGSAPLPFRDGSFGVVLCRDILEHVEVVDALREVHRVLADGGVVVVSAVQFSVRTFDFFVGAADRSWHRRYYFDYAFAGVDYAAIQFASTLGRGRFLVWDRVVELCVNRTPLAQDLYETTFLSRVFPAVNVVAVLSR